MKCNVCGAEIADGSKFCTNCGAPVSEARASASAKAAAEQALRCSQCGAELEPGQRFCTNCGAPVGEATASRDFEPEQMPAADAEAFDHTVAMPVINAEQPVRNGGAPTQGSARPPKARSVAPVVAVVLVLLIGVSVAAAFASGFVPLPLNEEPAQAAADADAGSADAEETDGAGETDEGAAQGGASADDEPPASAGSSYDEDPQVRASVNDYSWDELSEISALIAQASSDTEGLQIAERYHLCAADGTLDGSQTKQVALKDGTATSVQVAGFRHDTRSDGEGLAGITFIFTDAVATHEMSAGEGNAGGWEASDLREWCNSELLARMPDDLQRAIVAADKLTNNTGFTYDPAAVTVTSDKLWLPSYNELIGDVDPSLGDNLPVFNAEGDKYQLYVDTDVLWSAENPILVKRLASSGETVSWWQRSPYPDNDDYVMDTGADGIPFYAHVPTKQFGVVPGFCV